MSDIWLVCTTTKPKPQTRFRVWEADSGIERALTYREGIETYLDPGNFRTWSI